MKKTLIIGASTNPERYSYKAAHRLKNEGYEIVNLGIKAGEVAGEEILLGRPELKDIHTVTLYVGPKRQPEYYDYILSLNPKRILFNPGTENDELTRLAQEKGIEALENCTLVLLSLKHY